MTDERLFEVLRARYEAGEDDALERALTYAVMLRCPTPKWAIHAFKLARTAGKDVFGRPPRQKGQHRRTLTQEAVKYEVWEMVQYFHKQKDPHTGRRTPIDDALFEKVSKMLAKVVDVNGFTLGKKTVVKKLYYAAERDLGRVKLGPEPEDLEARLKRKLPQN